MSNPAYCGNYPDRDHTGCPSSVECTAPTRYQQVLDYSGAYESEAYGAASGHAWDRLAAIAGEYQRGERSWEDAKRLVDETTAEVEAAAVAAAAEQAGERFIVGTPAGVRLAADGAMVTRNADARVFTDRREAEAVADAVNVHRPTTNRVAVLPYVEPAAEEPTTIVQRARAALREAGYPAEWYNTGGGCMVLRFEHGDTITAPWGETHTYEVMVSPDDGPFGWDDYDTDSGEVTSLAACVYTYDPEVEGHEQDAHRVLTIPLHQPDPYTELVVAVAALLTPREG